ncbi:MAG: CPBP family intramembrane glutamic endopeptidase [bacterium]|nr:CPBP family intramembrane glutamic endopeptidase [bacterium]
MEDRLGGFTKQSFGYFGKLLILIGMILVFGGTSAILSSYFCQWLYGIDITQINMADIKKEDVNVIASLKWIQTIGGGIGMFLLPALFFPRMLKWDANTLFQYKTPVKPSALLLSVLVVFLAVPGVSALFQLNQGLTFPANMKAFEDSIRAMEEQAGALTKIFVAADNMPMLLLNIFVVALVPAISEEFLFRGVLYQYTRIIFGNVWVAIIISALIFSGFHGQFYGFLPRFALGILMGYLFYKSGSIWVPILAHFVNNAMAVIMIYYEKDLTIFKIFDESYEFPWYISVLSIASVVAVCRFFPTRKEPLVQTENLG